LDLLKTQLSGAWGQAEDAAVLRQLRDQYKVQILSRTRPAQDAALGRLGPGRGRGGAQAAARPVQGADP
ncbi:hypothetical protein CKW48_21810, partial [Bordetella pertussis]